ncbi:hypothetical protein BH11MYX3_BH11MYX3_21290 [soil metagenome]
MHDQRRGQRQAAHPSKSESADGKVGKTTRVAAELGRESVQRRGKAGGATVVQLDGDGAGLDAASIHHHAARGVSGSGSALPFAAEIQRSFGAEHDVSSVRAHIGGAAAHASETIGASAYAMGDSVAFASAPDLHLAAHEAAHCVQQRAGVRLSSNVGQAGDVYERHADAVADRVVAGQSAAELLREHTGLGAPGGSAVQRNPPTGSAAPAPAPARPGTLVSGGAQAAGGGGTATNGSRSPDQIASELRGHVQRLVNSIVGAKEGHRSLDRNRRANRTVGWISEALSGAGDLPPLSMWTAVDRHALAAQRAAASYRTSHSHADLDVVIRELRAAESAYRECDNRLTTYRERTEDGAEQATETLQGVVAACAAGIAVAGAGLAVAYVAGTAATTAAMAGTAVTAAETAAVTAEATAAIAAGTAASGTTVLAAGAAGSGVAAGGASLAFGGARRAASDERFDVNAWLTEASEEAAQACIGALVGGALSRGFLVAFTRGITARMAPAALATLRASLGTSSALSADVANALVSQARQRILDFLSGVAANFVSIAVHRAIEHSHGHSSNESFLEECARSVTSVEGIVGMFQNVVVAGVEHHSGTRAAPAPGDAADHPASPVHRTPATRPVPVEGVAANASSGLRYGPDGRLLPPEAAVGTYLNPGPPAPPTPLTITPQHPAHRPGIDGSAAAAPARPETRVQEMTTVDPGQAQVGAPQPASFTAGQVGTGAPLPPARAIDPTPVAASREPYLLPSDWEGLPRGEHVDGVRTVYDPPADRGERQAANLAQDEASHQHEIEMESLGVAMQRAALRRAGSSGPPIGHTPWNEPIYASSQSTPVTSTGATPPRWRDLEGNWHFPNDGHVITRATQDVSTQESWAASRLNAAHDNATAQTNSTFAPGTLNRGEGANLGSHDDARRSTASQTSRPIDERIQVETREGTMSHEGGALRDDSVVRTTGPLAEGELVAPRAGQQPTPRTPAERGVGHILTGDASGGNAVVRVGTDNRSVLRRSEAGSMPEAMAPEHVHQEIRERITHEEREAARQAGEDPESSRNVRAREGRIASALQTVNDAASAERAAHVASHGESVQAPDVAQHTTGISSCGGLAVQGTSAGEERYRSLTHAAEFNQTTQYERLVDELGSALRSGSDDIRGVATIDPRARQRPADVDDQINDRYHSFPSREQLPERMAADLHAAHPDHEFRVDGQTIVATPQGGGPERRIQVQVEEAAQPHGDVPETRAMTVTRDGVVIRSQETGARRVIPWSRLGRQP